MSNTALEDRIKALLSTANEAIKADQLAKAADALREASHLSPNDSRVKEQWAAVQQKDAGGDVLELLRNYLQNQDETTGQRALQIFRSRQIIPKDAQEATELLLNAGDSAPLLDRLTGIVLSTSVEARKVVAAKLSGNATEIFQQFLHRGEESLSGLTAVALDDAAWSSSQQQQDAQRDIFRLCIATLIEAGAEHLERIMSCIARLLSVAPQAEIDLIDDDVADAILSNLDIRLEPALRSQTMLATSKLLEITKERGEELFSKVVTARVARQTYNDLIVAFSAAAAVFPIIPAVAARLFLIDGFVQQLVPNLEHNWEDGTHGLRKSQSLETAALELLSAACVDKACRDAIKTHCSHWLLNLTDERQGHHKAMAALVMAKISPESGGDMTVKLEQLVLNDDEEADQAIEGLAYTSLQPKVKEEIAGNAKLVQQLVKSLKERPSAVFGSLTVLSNLTAYRPSLSEEQKKLSQLKAYANSERPVAEDPLDDEPHVTKRCHRVLDSDVVPALIASCKQTTSLTIVALVVKIILSLAREQKHRPTMAQQGSVKLLLAIIDRLSKVDKPAAEASAIERDGAHALARLLISVNPSHVFSAGLPASSAVSALAPLLSQDQDSERRNLLPVFESLLALTNLASMEDTTILDQQLRLLWSELEDHLLFSSNMLVQRASVELLCNLMASPNCVAKFVGDGSKREASRMKILLALADVEDFATRRAAGGALAMLTEWDAAVTAILDMSKNGSPLGVKTLLKMSASEEEEMKHRGFACLANVVNAPGDVGKRGVECLKENNGVEIVQGALKGAKSRDVMAIGVEVLKKIM